MQNAIPNQLTKLMYSGNHPGISIINGEVMILFLKFLVKWIYDQIQTNSFSYINR